MGKDYRYYQDGQGGWFRAANDDMTRAFEGFTATPRRNKQIYIPKKVDNSEETARARDKYNATHDPLTGLPTNQGLEIVSPEFDLISLAPILKLATKYTPKQIISLAKSKLRPNKYNANWQGDAVELTKNRLRNGGFERLQRAHDENIINLQNIDTQTANPLLIKNNNLPLVYSPEKRAQLLSTNVEEVPSWYATGNPNHIGVSNSELGPVLYSDRPAQYMGRQASSDLAAHEYSHYVYTPSERLSAEAFSPVEGYFRYFRKANSGEIQARGTQIKNYFGMREGEELTADHLKYAAKHFVKDRGYDNGMTQFFQSIRDWDKTAKWLTKNAPGYIIGGYFGNNIYNTFDQ